MNKIGIVGAGFSGTALAAALHRYADKPLEIILFDKTGQFGAGFAYSTPFDYHLLNVRAKDMSAFEDEPSHFVDWLKTKTQATPEQFVSRSLYGDYLKCLIHTIQADHTKNISIKLMTAEVVDLHSFENKIKLTLNDGSHVEVNQAVLAIGNGSPDHFPFPVDNSLQCVMNPWHYTALEAIPADDTVMIIGTGLSMVDAVLTLHQRKHRGKIYTLSRHGLLPLPHSDTNASFMISPEYFNQSLRSLVQSFRKTSKQHMQSGGDWRTVINELRKYFPTLWENLTLKEKKQFIRHVMPYWNIHRHRIHDQLHNLLTNLSECGQLKVIAGRVMEAKNGNVQIKPRHTHTITGIQAKWLINCMGPSLLMKSSRDTFVSSLMKQVALDPLHLGFATTTTGELKSSNGNITPNLYSLGPPTKGMTWECLAVPEIRKQIMMISRHILRN